METLRFAPASTNRRSVDFNPANGQSTQPEMSLEALLQTICLLMATQALMLKDAVGQEQETTQDGDGAPSFELPTTGWPFTPPTCDPSPDAKPASPDDAPAGHSNIPNWDGPKPAATDVRPPDDHRSAEDILNGDPTLKNIGNQGGLKDNLKKQCGDWENDPDPNKRADAAYRASNALKYIKTSMTADGDPIPDSVAKDGKIDGFSDHGEAWHGSFAGMAQDFSRQGYGALRDDHRLDKATDSHVRTDGTTRDNAAVNIENIGKKLRFIPGLSNVLQGIGGADKDHAVGFGARIAGGFKGVVKTWKADFDGLAHAVKTGRLTPASILTSMYEANMKDQAKDMVKDKIEEKMSDFA